MKLYLFTLLLLTLPTAAQISHAQVSDKSQPPMVNSRAVSLPQPDYPPDAVNNCIKGEVWVRIEYLGGGGNPISAQMIGGYDMLIAAVEKAALQAKFNPTKGIDPNTKLSGILIYKFTAKPGLICIDTKKVLNDRAWKVPSSSLQKEFPDDDMPPPDKNIDVKVWIAVDQIGAVIYAKADTNVPQALKKYAEKFARKVRFYPMNDMGNIHALGFLLVRFDHKGRITLPQIPAQK